MVQGVVVQITTEAPSSLPPFDFSDREAHMDRVGGVVVILDLGLGQRGLLDHRPQHRLGALVEPAVHQELAELAAICASDSYFIVE